ncbi:MAG: hypothetical protein VKK99_08120 [Cyanobacteriota bacterium]|nr:hypothetical protein [Cyanobacteriota bacterium]
MARSLPVGGRLLSLGLALSMAGTLALTGCSTSTQEAAKQTGDAVGQAAKDGAGAVGDAAKEGAGAVGDAAKTAATATGKAALAPAVTPVIDLLKKSEGEVKAGNIAAAVAGMGGFKALWTTAAPIIQPLAGDKWPLINTAANLVLSTFAPGTTPTADKAGNALTGLIGPLSALLSAAK